MDIFGNFNNIYIQANKSKKYSNDTLFSRRETEYPSRTRFTDPISRITSAITRPYSSTVKVSLINRHKRKILKLPKKKSAFLNGSSKSSTKRLFHEEDYFHKNRSKIDKNSQFKSLIEFERFYNPKKNMRKDGFQNYNQITTNICNDNLNYISTIYLTETNTKKTPTMIRDIISNSNIDNSIEVTNYNYADHKNADILCKFMEERINFNKREDKKTEYKDNVTTAKNKKINIKRESIQEFKKKTREIKIFKFSLKAKEELGIRIKEKYENELGYINDKIESFHTWKKFNQDFFSNKIEEYLKFLMYEKSFEKNKLEDLQEEIIRIKSDITKINSKMAKMQLEKNKILRWIYFQIKLKEKKVILPSYYKLILENINDVTIYYETKIKKISSSVHVKNPESGKSINNLSLSVSVKKREKMKKSIKKNKASTIENTSLPNLKNELIIFLNKKEGKETYKKIKEYKNKLIYTVEEFYDRMSSLEREDLMLIECYTNLKYKIKDLRTQFDKVYEQNKIIFGSYYENLRNKENELNRLKINTSAMENIVNVFHNLNYYYKGLNKNHARTSLLKDEEKQDNEEIIPLERSLPQISINKKTRKKRKNKNKKITKEFLFDKVNKLFNMCKEIKFKEQKHYQILKEKEKILKNFGILYSIFYIEYCVNYLVDYARNFELNNKDGKKKMKRILFDIEKAHREEKAEELRNQRLSKHIKLEKEIKKKYDKIYLHNRQIDIGVKKKKKIIEVKQEKKTPSLDDFLYDNSSEEFSYYH